MNRPKESLRSIPDRLLMGPGPSNVAPEVLQALARPITGHLDPEFLATLDEISERLREIFRTRNEMTFAISGTGSAGMEAALTNLLEPGDEAIVCVNGVFGGRMADIASRAGASVVRVEAPWGDVIQPDDVADALRDHPNAKALAIVHAETSTGVAQPLAEIAGAVADHSALFVVDAVTSLGGMLVDVDGWGADVCYSGTQKCLSVPPGLSPITFSARAMDVVKSRSTPIQSWYLDVTMLEQYWGSDRVYHHTAPVAMLNGLHAGLGSVLREGVDRCWERHERNGSMLSKELCSRGFFYVAPEGARLSMLHCVRLPDGVDEAAVRARLLTEYGIEVGAGLGPFRGECWRIGLMGYTSTERNVLTFLAALDGLIRA